jgi:hypothetical protein
MAVTIRSLCFFTAHPSPHSSRRWKGNGANPACHSAFREAGNALIISSELGNAAIYAGKVKEEGEVEVRSRRRTS